MEIADNRAHTSLHPNAKLTDWGDGKEHPDDYSVTNFGDFPPTSSGGISSPNSRFAFTFACVPQMSKGTCSVSAYCESVHGRGYGLRVIVRGMFLSRSSIFDTVHAYFAVGYQQSDT